MAEIKKPTVENCGEPTIPEGPFITYCAYEYAAFYNCRGSAGIEDNQMSLNGSILTYTEGGNGTSTGSVGTRNLTGTYNGNPIMVIFMGLLSDGWTDFFIDPNSGGQALIGKWHAAPNHNTLANRSYIKLAKYVHVEYHMLSAEDLYGENEPKEGNEIWECPAQPQFENVIVGGAMGSGQPADPTKADFGQDVCPKYYKVSSCIDCAGNIDSSLSDKIFEIVDRKEPTLNNKKIIEYPDDSNDCYEWVEVQPQNEKIITRAYQETGFSSHQNCDECRRDYWIAVIAPVKAPETWLPTSLQWVPSFAVSIRADGKLDGPTSVSIAQGVQQGMMSFRRMLKGDALNDMFVAGLRGAGLGIKEFVYRGLNDVCYRVQILDAGACMDPLLAEWTYWAGNTRANSPHYVHSSAFMASGQIWSNLDKICDCGKAAPDQIVAIGQTETDKCLMVDGPAPQIISITPQRVEIEISKEEQAGGKSQKNVQLTFTVDAAGANLKYEWFREYQGRSNPIGGNSKTVTFSRPYKFSESHAPNIVFHYVWCKVSNNNGLSVVNSPNASITVVRIPHKLHPDGTDVRVADVKIWCLDQQDANRMKTALGNRIKTPAGARIKELSTQMKYIDPDTYTGSDADYLKKYYIQSDEPLCSKRYKIYKIISIRTIKWENLSPTHRGQQNPNDDERDLPKWKIPRTGYTVQQWQDITNRPASTLNIGPGA